MTAKQKQKNKQEAVVSVELCWTDKSWNEYHYWYKNDVRTFDKVNELIEATRRTPFIGIGKPEPLKGDLSGYYSRRITKEHRLVYLYENNILYIIGCRYHYDN